MIQKVMTKQVWVKGTFVYSTTKNKIAEFLQSQCLVKKSIFPTFVAMTKTHIKYLTSTYLK